MLKIIDDFLPEDEFLKFKNLFLDSRFPWYFNNFSVLEDDNMPRFGHIVYMDMEPQSSVWDIVKQPLIEALGLEINQSILRVKVNNSLKTTEIEQTPLHYEIGRVHV